MIEKKHPRVLAFSGHADVVNMHFKTRAGKNVKPDAAMFVDVLKDAPSRLKCVFLNGCKTKKIAQEIAMQLPHLTVICWSTVVEDKAALRFWMDSTSILAPRLKVLDQAEILWTLMLHSMRASPNWRCRYTSSPSQGTL